MAAYLDILKKYWGYDNFRGIQREIIESIGSGHDTLGLMPTGGGKSIAFQVPALAMPGVCVVVTPLIALMKDQVAHLRSRGIKAAAIYSGMARAEIVTTLENCIFGGVKLLYVSPERLGSPLFQTKLRHMHVSFITVDEAHCISQWGYDFRPSYLHIADIRAIKPGAPVLALTATATPKVVDDMMDRLEFKERNVFRMSFARHNLAYVVRKTNSKDVEMVHILSHVPGSAIVYVRSRARCKDLAATLEQAGITATFYHAGLEPAEKDERQAQWTEGRQRVMVATNAFGMGIDKADVRVVIHYDCPDSVEAYFQEAGRAGRDGRKAYAVLLWDDKDPAKMQRRVVANFPPKEVVANVYDHLAYFYQIGVGSGAGHTFSFDVDKFCTTYHFFPLLVNSCLHLLQNAGYLTYDTDPDTSARLRFLLGRGDLYRLQDMTAQEDAVVTSALRSYGGMFADYVYVDVALIARHAGLSEQQAYLVLKTLSQRHIVHFIPRRRVPCVTYLRDRVDVGEAYLPPQVYEERRQQFVERVGAMVAYAEEDGVCRGRQLLAYFGENTKQCCGICDVCVEHSREARAEEEQVGPAIMQLLSDGQVHDVRQLRSLPFPLPSIQEAVSRLVGEEKIHVDGLDLSL